MNGICDQSLHEYTCNGHRLSFWVARNVSNCLLSEFLEQLLMWLHSSYYDWCLPMHVLPTNDRNARNLGAKVLLPSRAPQFLQPFFAYLSSINNSSSPQMRSAIQPKGCDSALCGPHGLLLFVRIDAIKLHANVSYAYQHPITFASHRTVTKSGGFTLEGFTRVARLTELRCSTARYVHWHCRCAREMADGCRKAEGQKGLPAHGEGWNVCLLCLNSSSKCCAGGIYLLSSFERLSPSWWIPVVPKAY